MKLIVLSPPRYRENETDTVVNLFQKGLDIFHLRKPDFSLEQLRQYIDGIPEIFRNRIVLHHHHGLVETYKLKGVHYTQSHREKEIENILKIKQGTHFTHVSASFHNLGDVKRFGHLFDYLFLSPIFDSISKNNYKAAFDLYEMGVFLKSTPFKIMALGGVDEEKIKTIQNLGFAGAAVLGAVWKDKDPVTAFLKIKKATETA